MMTLRVVLLAGLLALTVGCGGGGGGGSAPPVVTPPPDPDPDPPPDPDPDPPPDPDPDPPPDPDPDPPPPDPTPDSAVGGLWLGTLNFTDGTIFDALGLVAETGHFHWLVQPRTTGGSSERQQIFGDFQIAGTSATATGAVSALPPGSSTIFGSTYGLTDIQGTITERDAFGGSFTTTGEKGDVYEGTFSLDYNPLYDRDSSLATLQGTYTTTSESLTLDGAGVLFYQSAATGCVANGTASVIDVAYNMYSVSMGVDSCTGDAGVRNGLTFSGLAYLRDGASANSRLELVTSASATDGYVIWSLSVEK